MKASFISFRFMFNIPYCLEFWPWNFFPAIFNQATKQDKRLLVEDSHAVYNL